jgi:Flp pilus assembly pilin Flp
MSPNAARRPGRQAGQGMMEYIIIAALIAVAAIGVYSAFGRTIRVQTAGMAQEAAGTKASISNATDASNAAAGRANDPQKVGMGKYNYANDQGGNQN